MDTLKAILLWTGWILLVIGIVCLMIDWIMCKNMYTTAENNYIRADAVREKVIGELKQEIVKYSELTGEEVDTGEGEGENKDEENKDGSDKDSE